LWCRTATGNPHPRGLSRRLDLLAGDLVCLGALRLRTRSSLPWLCRGLLAQSRGLLCLPPRRLRWLLRGLLWWLRWVPWRRLGALLGCPLRGLLAGWLRGLSRGLLLRQLFRRSSWRLLAGGRTTDGALRRWLLAGRLLALWLAVRFLLLLGVSVGV